MKLFRNFVILYFVKFFGLHSKLFIIFSNHSKIGAFFTLKQRKKVLLYIEYIDLLMHIIIIKTAIIHFQIINKSISLSRKLNVIKIIAWNTQVNIY